MKHRRNYIMVDFNKKTFANIPAFGSTPPGRPQFEVVWREPLILYNLIKLVSCRRQLGYTMTTNLSNFNRNRFGKKVGFGILKIEEGRCFVMAFCATWLIRAAILDSTGSRRGAPNCVLGASCWNNNSTEN